jgi:hypothetical protein
MTCRDFAAILFEFVGGELEPEHHQRAQEHALQCQHCSASLHSYRTVVSLSRRLQPHPMPATLQARLERLGDSGA